MQTVSTPHAPQAIGPYAQAIVHSGFVFCSGQIPLNPETMQIVAGQIVEQTNQVLANIDAVLTGAGTTKANVLKTTVFLKNMDDFTEMNAVYERYFAGHTPARSTVQVAKLPKDVLIEIEVIAAIG